MCQILSITSSNLKAGLRELKIRHFFCVFIYYVCFLIVDLIKLVSKHRAQLIYTRMTKGEEDEQ